MCFKQFDTYPPLSFVDEHGEPFDLTGVDVHYQVAYPNGRRLKQHRARVLDAKRGLIARPRTRVGPCQMQVTFYMPDGLVHAFYADILVLPNVCDASETP